MFQERKISSRNTNQLHPNWGDESEFKYRHLLKSSNCRRSHNTDNNPNRIRPSRNKLSLGDATLLTASSVKTDAPRRRT
jgi:hypothetical protein